MIEVKELTRYYGEIRAIHNVSFQVKKGEILGLLGPNAAGKSNLLDALYLRVCQIRLLICTCCVTTDKWNQGIQRRSSTMLLSTGAHLPG